jgi:DNA polymerase (family 10)
MKVPGLGPKKAAVLFETLGIESVEQLRAACEEQKIRELKGFGEKTEQSILASLAVVEQASERVLWAVAETWVERLLAHMKTCDEIQKIAAAGSFRRGRDTVGDLDLLVVCSDGDEAMDRLGEFDSVQTVIGRGDTKMSVRLAEGLQIDLRVVPEESFGAALLYFTGSKEHNVELRGTAKRLGLKINEYGVFRDEQYIAGREEADVYAAVDLPWIPPELREARREFQWAADGCLPQLIEISDLRGDLHMHTRATDGRNTIEEMAEGAKRRGLKYIAITDHSQRVAMANGLTPDRARQQWDEVDRINDSLKGIHVLKGIECDILEKGGMDLPDDVLARADWVVASVHYGQNQTREEITRRIVGAIENPHVSCIAHPTGRLLLRRKSYEVDLEAVYKAAREHGKFLELNANPKRLDLDDVACAAAKEHGVGIVISSDAHHVDGLDVLRYGVVQARRAGLTKLDVVNTLTWSQIKKRLGKT